MMGGDGGTKGVIPRSLEHILGVIHQDPEFSYTINIGFVQVYMEMLQDLLFPESPTPIKLREDPTEGVYLTGSTWKSVHSLNDCLELMQIGDKNRNAAFTNMNAHSSRSHAVFMVKIEKRLQRTEAKEPNATQVLTSTLFLVDLAGSERVKKSKATGLRFDEAKNINLALLALGNCIQALADKKSKFVPFRDSKLTRLLANSLGGKSKTSLIITVGPSLVHVNETLMTLGFGARAMKIEVTPSVSKLIDYKAVSAKLKAELELLNEKYQALVRTNEKLLGLIEVGKKEMEHVTMEQLKAEQTAKDYLKLMDGTVEKEKANAGTEQLNELQAIYEEKIHRKDEEYTKLLKDFDQFIQESDAENEKLRKENAQFAESNNNFKQKLNTLKSEREEESASIAAQLSQVAQENVSFKAEIEDLRDECNAKEIVIKNHESRKKTLEEKNRKLVKDLEELRKGIPGPKQTDAERTRDAQKDQMIQELEFLNGKLETELREAELLLGEKREEIDQIRAELAKTDIKSLKKELERANKEAKNQNQAKKALEQQISDLSFQLQVSLSTPQPAPSVQSYALSETQARFAETLLLPLQDSLEVDYDQLESKLMTVLESVTSSTPPTEAAIADFSEALYTATHPETANQLSNLKTTICDLEDQLNIANQHAESQKEQYTELVRGYIDATV